MEVAAQAHEEAKAQASGTNSIIFSLPLFFHHSLFMKNMLIFSSRNAQENVNALSLPSSPRTAAARYPSRFP
jgi:hypothetical protein